MDMLRTMTDLSLGVFAAASVAVPILGQAAEGFEGIVNKLGALGLCAFMVLQNYRQSEATAKVLREKDRELADLTRQSLHASKNQVDAINDLSAALRNRPCIVGDRRFDDKPKDTGD